MQHNNSLRLPLKKSKITIRNVLAVIQAYFRKARMLDGYSLPSHIYEQIIWRRTQVMKKSPSCWERGECRVCGCEILGKTMEDRNCSATDIGEEPCYPTMMKKDEWRTYKTSNNIKLFSC
jgi:hypothetical protein